MTIHGTALLSICLLLGMAAGHLLGALLGVNSDVGGVGIAMLLLILSCDRLQKAGRLKAPTQEGIAYWSAMYIPIVVAMAASQNVIGAIKGGLMAILAGGAVVAFCFGLVGVLARSGGDVGKEWAKDGHSEIS